jgi:hypothetical protein
MAKRINYSAGLALIKTKKTLEMDGLRLSDIDTLKPVMAQFRTSLGFDDDEMDEETIPLVYTKDSWKKSTRLACANCTTTFTSVPIPVVTDIYMKADSEGKRMLTGDTMQCCFCSPMCAQTYIDERFGDTPSLRDSYSRYLLVIIEDLLKIKADIIPHAPDKITLKKFSGSSGIDEAEYRRRVKAMYNNIINMESVNEYYNMKA